MPVSPEVAGEGSESRLLLGPEEVVLPRCTVMKSASSQKLFNEKLQAQDSTNFFSVQDDLSAPAVGRLNDFRYFNEGLVGFSKELDGASYRGTSEVSALWSPRLLML